MILSHYWPRLWPKQSENLKVTCSENPPRIIHGVWMRYEWPYIASTSSNFTSIEARGFLTTFARCDGSCSRSAEGLA